MWHPRGGWSCDARTAAHPAPVCIDEANAVRNRNRPPATSDQARPLRLIRIGARVGSLIFAKVTKYPTPGL